MDAGIFIYFPRDPGKNIYFPVVDGQDIYFKKLPDPAPPPPPESTVRPLTKKAPVSQFQPFPNSTDCHTRQCSTGFGLVMFEIEFTYYYLVITR